MKKHEKIYKKLREQYSENEIAESLMIPEDLTSEERKNLAAEMKAIRFQKLKETTEEEQILSDVMRLRFQIENYIQNQEFSFDKTFGKHLEEYIRIVKKSRKEIAEDLSIHYTKLSRIVNDKEEPNVHLFYRLEKYTANLINADLWWKLMIKKQEFMLHRDDDTRNKEHNKVKNPLRA